MAHFDPIRMLSVEDHLVFRQDLANDSTRQNPNMVVVGLTELSQSPAAWESPELFDGGMRGGFKLQI